MTWNLSFPPPAEMLNLNRHKQWWVSQPLKVAWRDSAAIHARQAIIRKELPSNLSQVTLLFDFPVFSLRTCRDAHNVAPTCKACIDGMVTTGLLVDDSIEHLTLLDSTFHSRKANPNVTIYIRKRTS